MQDLNFGYGGWPKKKSKLAVEEGATANSAAEDNFNKDDGSRSDLVGDGLGGFGSDSDGDEEQNP